MEMVSEVKFRDLEDDRIQGIVVNPGGWFGKIWMIQLEIANALNPFFIVEADSERDAIDEFADSRYSHLIDVSEEDCPKFDEETEEFEETDYDRAGNDSHWVDLTRFHLKKAPASIRYCLEWNPEQDGLSSEIDTELELVREEKDGQ